MKKTKCPIRQFRCRKTCSLTERYSGFVDIYDIYKPTGAEYYERKAFSSDSMIERAQIIRSSGKFVIKHDPSGIPFPWREPSPYKRGHIAFDKFPEGPVKVEFETNTWKGFGLIHNARPHFTFLESIDLSKFLDGMTQNFVPKLTYNELARNNTAVRLKLKDQKINVSLALAEFHKSVRTVTSTMRDLLGIYSAVKRGKFRRALNYMRPTDLKGNRRKKFSSRDPAGRWLELQYGWGPIMNDLSGAYDYLLENKEKALTYSVSSSFYEEISPYETSTRDGLATVRGIRGVRTKVHYTIDMSDVHEATRLGLTNPLLVVWDIIPYSFVIDWLVPVGSFLEALDATNGLSFVSGTRTRFCEGTFETDFEHRFYTGAVTVNARIPISGAFMARQRDRLTDFPYALPYVKNPFSGSHLTTVLSLLSVNRK